MNHITISSLYDSNIVTIPRSCLPDVNTAMIIAIIESLTSANAPVENAEDYLAFSFDNRIPQSILFDFFHRWGVNVEGMEKI